MVRETTSRGRFRRRQSYTGRVEGQSREPIYVSAKRTHRFFHGKSVYSIGLQRVVRETRGFFRWVRFPKRTHRRGVLRADMMVLRQNLERFRTLMLLGGSLWDGVSALIIRRSLV